MKENTNYTIIDKGLSVEQLSYIEMNSIYGGDSCELHAACKMNGCPADTGTCATDACPSNICASNAGCVGNMCATDACATNACGANACMVNGCLIEACPFDACAVDGCVLDIAMTGGARSRTTSGKQLIKKAR